LASVGPQTRASALNGVDLPTRSAAAARLAQQQTETKDSMTGQQSLRVLPERTGGRTIVNRNNPDEEVPAIFRESEAYYVLGVERETSDRPESPRSIEVKVGRPGVRVYAQRKLVLPTAQNGVSMVSQAPRASASAAEALNRLLPTGTLPLSLAVAAIASPESTKALVRLNIDAGAFAGDKRTAVPLELAIMAVDQTGRPVASARQTSTIPAGVRTSGPAAEVNVPSHLELEPGEYGVRVAVSDPATGEVASVFSDVTIPKFDSDALSLSGVIVEIASHPSATPAPTTRRRFNRDQRVRALLQIYQGTHRTGGILPVSMRVQIFDGKGGAVRDQSLPFTEQTFTNRRASCVITIPVANLPPGEYVLRLEASADRQKTGRALRFTVE